MAQTKTKTVMAQTVCVIVYAIALAVVSVWGFSFLWGFWRSFEFVSAVCVAFGCIGELLLFINPPPTENKKSPEYKKHRLKELLCITLVAMGVSLEILALNHNMHESDLQSVKIASLTNEAIRLSINLESAKSNNLVLQKQIAELQPRLQPIGSVSASITLHIRSSQLVRLNLPKEHVTNSQLTIIIKNPDPVEPGPGLFFSFNSDNELRPIMESVMRQDTFDISSSFHPVSLSFDVPYRGLRFGGTIIGMPVSLIDDIDQIVLTLFNDSIDADVSGSVKVVFNGTARTFGIPNQKFNSRIIISGLAITNLPPKQ